MHHPGVARRGLRDREVMTYDDVSEPTLASTWRAMAASPITDSLLEWPPDVFALANVILAWSEGFRFVLSPVGEWPPGRYPDWERRVREAALNLECLRLLYGPARARFPDLSSSRNGTFSASEPICRSSIWR